METKRDDDYGWTLMGRLMLLGASQVGSGCALGLYLLTKERDRRSVPQRALGEVARHDHAHTGGASRSGRIREEAKVSELSKTVRFLAQVPLFRGLKKRQL